MVNLFEMYETSSSVVDKYTHAHIEDHTRVVISYGIYEMRSSVVDIKLIHTKRILHK